MDDDRDPDRDGDAEPGATRPAPEASGDSEVDALLDDWLAGEGGAVARPETLAQDRREPPPAAGGSMPTLLDVLGAEAPIEAPIVAAEADGDAAADVPRHQFVLFSIAGSAYAVLESFVAEVGRVPTITQVPRVPAWLRGVTSVRGEVLSVIDLRTLLGLEPASLHIGRLLTVRLLDEEFSVGLVVDAVDQIAAIADADVRPPASPVEGALGPYLRGVGQVKNRLVAVLDLDALLHSAEIRQFDDQKDAEPAA